MWVYSSLLRKSGSWTSTEVCAWLKAWKGNVPALRACRHQPLGTNLIAVFFTQTCNSSWHIDICWILLKLNWNSDILVYILYCNSADSRGTDTFNNFFIHVSYLLVWKLFIDWPNSLLLSYGWVRCQQVSPGLFLSAYWPHEKESLPYYL